MAVAARVRLLSPLRERDFALLWAGMTISLLGDGVYFIAVAWEAYSISNSPGALAAVGVAWTLPTVILLLFGGAVSDRVERRKVLLAADLVDAVAIGTIGVLAVTNSLTLPLLLVLVAIYGAGEAFFNPAFDAIVPDLLPTSEYATASALDHFVRPLALQFIGPALGGLILALTSPGVAFLFDAFTFLAATLLLFGMRRVPAPAAATQRTLRASVRDIGEGFAFVRANPWLWGTLAAAGLSLFGYFGPLMVLVPYLVKNGLHAGGDVYGILRAVGGVGAIIAAFTVAQRGLPRRSVTAMFVSWSGQSALLAAFAAANQEWLFLVIALFLGGLGAVGNTVWGTLMKTLVPSQLLGRVSSFDWFVSIALLPLSFAVTAPIAAAIGARTTLVVAGLLSGVAMMAFLGVPGLRDPERTLALALAAAPEPEAEPDPLAAVHPGLADGSNP